MSILGTYYAAMAVINGLYFYKEEASKLDEKIKHDIVDILTDTKLDLTSTQIEKVASACTIGVKVTASMVIGTVWPVYTIYNVVQESVQLAKAVA
jgi:hypothetical protein